MSHRLILADTLERMQACQDDSFGMVITAAWHVCSCGTSANWSRFKDASRAVWEIKEMVRITSGPVMVSIPHYTFPETRTWCGCPAIIMAGLASRGIDMRAPFIHFRHGETGSGGDDWLKSNYEMFICCAKPGRFPYVGSPTTTKHHTTGPFTYAANNSRPSDVLHNTAQFKSLIQTYCRPGDAVLDPYCTMPEVGAVAIENGRMYVAISDDEDALYEARDILEGVV